MDVVSSASAVVGLVFNLATAAKTCKAVRGRYKDAALTIDSIRQELETLQAALQQLANLMMHDASALTSQWDTDQSLSGTFSRAVKGFERTIKGLQAELDRLRFEKETLGRLDKARVVWNEDGMREHLARLRSQAGALQLLLHVLQVGAVSEVKQHVKNLEAALIQASVSSTGNDFDQAQDFLVKHGPILDDQEDLLDLKWSEKNSASDPSHQEHQSPQLELLQRAFASDRDDIPRTATNATTATTAIIDGESTAALPAHQQTLFSSTEVAKSTSDADIVFLSVNTPTKMIGIGAGAATNMVALESPSMPTAPSPPSLAEIKDGDLQNPSRDIDSSPDSQQPDEQENVKESIHSAASTPASTVSHVDSISDQQWKPDGHAPELIKAVIRGDYMNVVELLEIGHDIDACDPVNGRTGAIFASLLNHFQILELLLNRGANITAKDRDGRTALHFAASEGSCRGTELLLSSNAPVDTRDNFEEVPLHRASRYGKTEIVKLLLPHHPDPLALVEVRHQNALHLAVQYGKIETIESICRYIRDNNHLQDCSVKEGDSATTPQGCSCPASYPRLEDADRLGFTALHIGLVIKRPRAVSSLLQFSKSIADRPMRWEELTPERLHAGKPLLWRRPLHHALKNVDMVKALLDGGADTSLTDCKGQTPLMVAIHKKNEEATKLFLAHGADFLTPCEVHQCNALHDAAIQFSPSILDQVDIRDSRNDISTDRGRVILQEAQNNRRWDIVQALIENCHRKEAVGTILDEEETLLPALQNSTEPVVDLLLANGANPNCKLHYAKDDRWALPLHVAAEKDTITVAQALLRNGAGLLLENRGTRLPYEVAIHYAGIDTVGWFLKETIAIIRKQTRTSEIVDTVTKVVLKSGDRACRYGSLETLELVLRIGKQEVDNFVQKSRFLHVAIRYGRIRLVKYLLDSGFEPNFLDGGDYTFCSLDSMHNQRGNKAEDYEGCIKMAQEAIDSRGVHSPKTRRALRLSREPTPAR